jgi:DNA (cytosine-5)-methyltransferase 1
MNVLDLFSGVGGFSLGLERAGFRTVAFCEIEPYCRAVLRKHWPEVPIYEDVRTLTADQLGADGIAADVICGGFPCQDISLAGRGAGLDGDRSGLWSEYRRLIAEVRPRFVIIENSPALRTRGADRVIADLEEIDYTCEPFVVGAIHVGAPHRRQRAWLVAHANGLEHKISSPAQQRTTAAELPADLDGERLEIVLDGHAGQLAPAIRAHAWSFEPDVVRVAYGVPSRAHRIKALGNAVVPQIPEAIGRALMSILHEDRQDNK